MKIVAIAMAKNEADIIGEGVSEALSWVDRFVIYDNGSTDGTAAIAKAAGAAVITGPPGEPFNEALRQHTLTRAMEYKPDWIIRIDVDEIYHPDPDPRGVLKDALADNAFCVRALQMEFWPTLDDVRRGLLLEDDHVSIQLRRRWYTCGHMAMVAWRPHPDLAYRELAIQKRRNVPTTTDGRDVSELGPVFGTYLVQKHYNCRSLPQILKRIKDRRDHNTFGKYRYNLIVDERMAELHYLGPDDKLCFKDNHDRIYDWYTASEQMLEGRQEMFGWNRS